MEKTRRKEKESSSLLGKLSLPRLCYKFFLYLSVKCSTQSRESSNRGMS